MIRWVKSFIRRVGRRVRSARQVPLPSNHSIDCGILIAEAQLSLPKTMPWGIAWPKISVITPSFNQGRYIAETIESVLLQGYPNVEHIIIDGGSSDDTMQVVERYRSQLHQVVSEPDRGQSHALNKGFHLATGDILCWLNSDDQFAPGALAAVAIAFATRDVDLVSGICEIYKNDALMHRHMTSCADGPLPLQDLLDLDNGWNAGQFFYQPEVFFSRELWERSGGHVREDCYYSMDYELWCRFAHVGANLHVIGAPLARFRMHPKQKTANPANFKKELVEVRDRFAATHSIKIQASVRPPARFDRTLRVAMVNDIGVKYGAGIAHGRLAAGLDMAGHDIKMFDLRYFTFTGSGSKEPDEAGLVKTVIQFDPDVVVFGNLHSVTRDSIAVLEELSARFPSFWVTHDFWLFTGRCAYTRECKKYLSGCDASCPTAQQYPDLAPRKISGAWKRKQSLLGGPHSPFILANSVWSEGRARESLSAIRSDAESRIRRIQLGAPVSLFKPFHKMAARNALGVKTDHFVISFSVSSLAEERKGGHYLVEALRDINLPNLSLILIGDRDAPLEINGVELVPLGYVTETSTLTAALSASDVYVGPSTEETFGQVFIEAALVGTPSIGLDQTGVRDAIAEGVTGLRVSSSAQALREAIVRLYHDRDMCESLGSWARIYALNEFSLESSYHSLFTAWRELGLVDQWEAPHKIGFVRNSAFVDASSRWGAVYGVSAIEGPYPQFDIPTTFQWFHGSQSRVVVDCPEKGRYLIRLAYYNNLFESIEVKLHVNDEPLDPISMKRTKPRISEHAEFQINGLAGSNFIDFLPSQAREPTHDDPRALTFMLREIKLQRIDN
jgi:glycosyltransferase involved in cell wall biosynthesis